jgi:WD40 repeat protein
MDNLGEHSTARPTDSTGEPSAAQAETLLTPAALDAAESTEAATPPALPHGDSIPGYEILREIHRGGQGVVYQAVQKSTNRKVAIKVMREGPFAGTGDKARFEREVQILGQLQHPNIVAVHDSGSAAGSFYFVMDYISGQPLDVYLAGAAEKEHGAKGSKGPGRVGLSIDSTLKLFAKICEAVNAAHLRGVIHRDLKPGNIRIDAQGEPHVLDFGLAKVAGGPMGLGELAAMTLTGQFVGSLPWSAPEQAEGAPSKIDTRTDVYSLGVVLYQMLTGKFPYEVVGNMRDVLDRIMNAEPVKPSTLGGASASRRRINDEVETIVLKCLSKERERRYQTGGELARDIQHYLAGEAIEAKRDSAFYMLKKQLRRYKGPAAVAATFVVLLVAFGISMSVLAARERVARDRADGERQRADTQAADAIRQRDEAERQRREARWQSYLADIGAAETALQAGEIANVRQHLDAAPLEFRNWEWSYLNACVDTSLLTLREPGGWVTAVAFSPDGNRVLAGSQDGIVRTWDAATGAEVGALTVRAERVVCFSLDGTRFVTTSRDTARIWDAVTGLELTTLREPQSGIVSTAFSPDGTRFVTTSGAAARIWDATTGTALTTLDRQHNTVTAVAFSPQGTRILTGYSDADPKLWDATTGAALATLRGHENAVFAAVFSPDGTRVLTGSAEGTARLWDAVTGAQLAMLRGHEDAVCAAAFSPDGTLILTGSYDKTARVWDAGSGVALAILRGHEGDIRSVAFSPDGTRLLTGANDKTTRLWRAPTRAVVDTLLGKEHGFSWSFSPNDPRPLTASVRGRVRGPAAGPTLSVLRSNSAAFSPDGTRLLTWGNSIAGLWDIATGDALATPEKNVDGLFRSEHSSPDGTRVLTGSLDGTGRLWDAASGAGLAMLRDHDCVIKSAAFSPDGTRVLTGCEDCTARIWDAATGAELAVLRGHLGAVWSTRFSPDGTRIVTSSEHDIRLWDAATGAEVATLGGRWTLLFSPDGTRIVTSADDNTARTWDTATGAEMTTLGGRAICFRPDGTRIVTAADDNTARIWDTATGAELTVLQGHEGVVSAADFSPDGTRVLTGSADHVARLWDAATGAPLITLRGHQDEIRSVTFSPDGTRVLTHSSDGTARLWDSVPNAKRFAESEAARAAARQATPLVQALHDQLGDWSKVAEVIRSDHSLQPLVRQQACNVMWREASRTRDDADRLVNELAEQGIVSEWVVEQLGKDASLSPEMRGIAIARAQRMGDDYMRLNNAAWKIVASPQADATRYAIALRAAQVAVSQVPEDGKIRTALGESTVLPGGVLNTLGVAQYRVGQYEEALETLTHSGKLHPGTVAAEGEPQSGAPKTSPISAKEGAYLGYPQDIAFIAMSLYRLGRVEEAQAALAQLRDLMRGSNDEESEAFLAEAEALITGAPSLQPSAIDKNATTVPSSQPPAP